MAVVKVAVRGTALRLESDHFPGWIEVSIRDSQKNEHRIIDKVPVLTVLNITAESLFPIELWIDAELVSVARDEIVLALSHGVETRAGVRELTVASSDVIWL
jgi:hypothetical protein